MSGRPVELISARRRSRVRPKFIVIPAAIREGRVRRQARRCLVANRGQATTANVLAWAYPRGERRHWQFEVVREALAKLGAKPIARGNGRGRPIIWALSAG